MTSVTRHRAYVHLMHAGLEEDIAAVSLEPGQVYIWILLRKQINSATVEDLEFVHSAVVG
jgi:hypothetical protein